MQCPASSIDTPFYDLPQGAFTPLPRDHCAREAQEVLSVLTLVNEATNSQRSKSPSQNLIVKHRPDRTSGLEEAAKAQHSAPRALPRGRDTFGIFRPFPRVLGGLAPWCPVRLFAFRGWSP